LFLKEKHFNLSSRLKPKAAVAVTVVAEANAAALTHAAEIEGGRSCHL
jgi:hypothetical protein